MRLMLISALLSLPLVCFAQGRDGPRLVLRDGVIPEAAAGGSAAISADIYNPTDTSLTIVGAASPVATQTLMQTYSTSAAGVREVHALKELSVPAKGSVELVPGKLELRLIGLTEDLHADNELPLLIKTDKTQGQVLRVKIIRGYAN